VTRRAGGAGRRRLPDLTALALHAVRGGRRRSSLHYEYDDELPKEIVVGRSMREFPVNDCGQHSK